MATTPASPSGSCRGPYTLPSRSAVPRGPRAARRARCSPPPRTCSGRRSVGAAYGGLVQREVAPFTLPIDRTAGGREEEPCPSSPPGRLEQVQRPGDVDVQVEDRIRDRAADVDLGGEVEDDLRPPLVEQVGDRGGVRTSDSTSSAPAPIAPVEVLPASAREVVDHDDVVAALDQRVDQVRADESGPAGDQGLHGAGSLVVRSPGGRRIVGSANRPTVRDRGPEASGLIDMISRRWRARRRSTSMSTASTRCSTAPARSRPTRAARAAELGMPALGPDRPRGHERRGRALQGLPGERDQADPRPRGLPGRRSARRAARASATTSPCSRPATPAFGTSSS